MSAPITEDEHRVLITAVLYQAIKEYMYPTTIQVNRDRNRVQRSAASFLFNDDYLLDWGDKTLSPRDLLLSIDLDIDWIRARVVKKVKKVGTNSHYPLGKSLL